MNSVWILGKTMPSFFRLLFTLLGLSSLLSAPSRLHAADSPHPPRVLIVNSFGSRAPPFTTHSTAFETTITRELGTQVDLDEVSLDMARFSAPDMEEAFADLLRQRLSKWQPDLVATFGSPAAIFVANYRARLFPLTPVLYDGMDKSRLPQGALDQNTAFVGSNFDLQGFVQDILQLKPDTDHIVVIFGATPLERYWTTAFSEAFRPYSGRIRFTFTNDLSFEQMLDLVSKLPPRSFVLLGLLLRDAAGVTHNSSDALVRLNAVTAAPINAIYHHDLGLGIVGGRLYQGELEGSEGARIAIQILRGAPPSQFPPEIISAAPPQYDWRELRRWRIPENRLPPGSTILFQQPTLWERYRVWIITALAIISVQSAMILALIVQRRRRRRVQEALRQSQQLIELATGAGDLGLWSRDEKNGQLWLNAPMRSLLGFAPDAEVRFADILARVDPDHRHELPFEGELRLVLPGGIERWVLSKSRIVTDSFLPPRRMGVLLDITERKRAESELRRHRDELAHVSRVTAMGELTASLAHELSQPLLAIMTNAQSAQTFLSAQPSQLDELRGIMSDIVHDNRRASEIIRRIRVLMKKETPEFAPIDLPPVIHEIVRLIDSDAASRGLRVSLDIQPDLPRARGIGVQVQQVLLNLLLNAFEAMSHCKDQDRQVQLRAALDDEGMIRISIRDQGAGLPAESNEKVFQPFFTTKPNGLGMGLPISRSIIEAHSGRLWAQNNPDRGATFHFTIPQEAAPQFAAVPAATTADLAPAAH